MQFRLLAWMLVIDPAQSPNSQSSAPLHLLLHNQVMGEISRAPSSSPHARAGHPADCVHLSRLVLLALTTLDSPDQVTTSKPDGPTLEPDSWAGDASARVEFHAEHLRRQVKLAAAHVAEAVRLWSTRLSGASRGGGNRFQLFELEFGVARRRAVHSLRDTSSASTSALVRGGLEARLLGVRPGPSRRAAAFGCTSFHHPVMEDLAAVLELLVDGTFTTHPQHSSQKHPLPQQEPSRAAGHAFGRLVYKDADACPGGDCSVAALVDAELDVHAGASRTPTLHACGVSASSQGANTHVRTICF